MAFQVRAFEPTPNPNALKVVLDRSPTETPKSYRDAAAAAGDPLASALFAIPGVSNVLLHEGWLTVGKDAGAEWKALRPRIERVLREAQG
jgi:NFU1 iron-sulfur cluster scaffold homolog, mitochondrial